MSLIFEALKKLERQKDAPNRGFVVLAHLPWAASAGRGRAMAFASALLVAGLLLGGGLGLWLASRPHNATHAPAPASAPAAPAAASVPAVAPLVVPSPRPLAPPPLNGSKPSASAPSASASHPGADADATADLDAAAHSASPLPAEFRLNAISVQDGHPVAVLNDRLVREGDSFNGIKVLRIGESEVEIEVRGERRVVRF